MIRDQVAGATVKSQNYVQYITKVELYRLIFLQITYDNISTISKFLDEFEANNNKKNLVGQCAATKQ